MPRGRRRTALGTIVVVVVLLVLLMLFRGSRFATDPYSGGAIKVHCASVIAAG